MTITRVELIPSRPRPKNRSRWPVKFKKRSEKGPDEQPGGEISLHADEQDLFDRHDLPWDGDGPYPAFKTIQEFYRDYQELVKHDKLDLNKCRYSEIWLDDREYGTERAREYDVDLDAERLKRLLLTPVKYHVYAHSGRI